jgi:hypothetical protein
MIYSHCCQSCRLQAMLFTLLHLGALTRARAVLLFRVLRAPLLVIQFFPARASRPWHYQGTSSHSAGLPTSSSACAPYTPSSARSSMTKRCSMLYTATRRVLLLSAASSDCTSKPAIPQAATRGANTKVLSMSMMGILVLVSGC